MPRQREHALARFLHKIAAPAPAADAFLLQKFVDERDEAAFAALLQRHGPMVLGVCRRVLRNRPAAEDAFQATFLILVQKARTLGQPDRLGSWLYGVAYRTALKARALSLRRRETTGNDFDVASIPATSSPELAELHSILDREVSRLPEKYRVPIVLCYLEGKTHEQAARLLDCQRLAVAKRLSRARELLRGRLTRHGFAVTSGVVATLLTQAAHAVEVPHLLFQSTRRLAVCAAAGPASSPSVVAASVVALSKGVTEAMFFTKIKTAAAVALAIALLAALAGVFVVCDTAGARGAAFVESPSVAFLNEVGPAEPPASNAAGDKNLLQNPSAEEGTDAPAHWSKGAEVDGVEYLWDKHTAKKGNASLCLHKTADRYFPIAQWHQTLDHQGDKPALRLSAQVKADQVTKAILDVAFLDDNGDMISHKWAAYIGAKQAGDPPANHDWKEYAGRVDIPAGAKKIQVGLQIYGPGKVWFDDVAAKYEK